MFFICSCECASLVHLTITGDNGKRDPPVLIPNTEVKPLSADGTWLETARESRTLPVFYSSLAQQVEHAAVNRRVVGSSPTGGATQTEPLKIQRLCFHQSFQGPLAQLVRATGS